MLSSTFTISSLLSLSFSLTYAIIAQDSGPPAGYQEGYATQDMEPVGQLSICQTNCGLGGTNRGTPDMAQGVYAAAVGPNLGGASDNCGPCGSCYSIINSGQSYCQWDEDCPVAVGPGNQNGPKEIKIIVVNHCMDCDDVDYHFDIHGSPGWNNPKIWWKPLDASECRSGGGGSSPSSSSSVITKSSAAKSNVKVQPQPPPYGNFTAGGQPQCVQRRKARRGGGKLM
ncbi:MAG: hypothetical protein Q9197_003886 [Variospora fuerteventurae]